MASGGCWETPMLMKISHNDYSVRHDFSEHGKQVIKDEPLTPAKVMREFKGLSGAGVKPN